MTIRGHEIDVRIVARWQTRKDGMDLVLQWRAGEEWEDTWLIHDNTAPSDRRSWLPSQRVTVAALNARSGRDVAVVRVVGRWAGRRLA